MVTEIVPHGSCMVLATKQDLWPRRFMAELQRALQATGHGDPLDFSESQAFPLLNLAAFQKNMSDGWSQFLFQTYMIHQIVPIDSQKHIRLLVFNLVP